MSSIFISYAREDRDSALRLCKELRQAGLEPWIDLDDLIGGQDWRLAIEQAIRSSSYFVALISKNSVSKRGYVQKELREAMDVLRQLPPGQVYLVPVRLDESVPLHQVLADLHWIDLFSSYSSGIRRLLKSFGADGGERVKTSEQFSSVPAEVLTLIQSRAERDLPDDVSTRHYRVDTELKAWRNLQTYSPQDIPLDTLQHILDRACADFPDDFGARLHRIDIEVEAWKALQVLSFPGIPYGILDVIIGRAERDFPSYYSTRIHKINTAVNAWLALQYDDTAEYE